MKAANSEVMESSFRASYYSAVENEGELPDSH
jgi:hypothetical protein